MSEEDAEREFLLARTRRIFDFIENYECKVSLGGGSVLAVDELAAKVLRHFRNFPGAECESDEAKDRLRIILEGHLACVYASALGEHERVKSAKYEGAPVKVAPKKPDPIKFDLFTRIVLPVALLIGIGFKNNHGRLRRFGGKLS